MAAKNDDQIVQMRETLGGYLGQDWRYSLPPQFYTSRDFLEFETEELLRREWLCLGRADEVPEPGDYYTIEMLDEQLLVVRGDDRKLRVLSNVCRHRGMLVAQGNSAEQGRARQFVCPYHAWSYDREGGLKRAPMMDPALQLNRKTCRLPELNSEIWQGFLYVNIDGEAEPLAPRLTGLDEVLANYHSDEMHHVFVAEEVWDANWKCLVENFMEGYHLSMVHPQTLGGRTPTQLCEKLPAGEGYTGYRANYPEDAPFRGRCHADLTARERGCSTLFSIFPCQVVSQASDILVYMALQPAGVDKVRIRWGAALYDAGMSPDEVQSRLDLWREINAEDRAKLACVQAGLKSRHAAPGPLAPDDYEGTIWDFYQYLAGRLGLSAEHAVA